MRLIDADALIDDLKHDVAIDQDSLDYEELTVSNRENIQFDKDCKQNAIDLLRNAPTIEERKTGVWLDDEDNPESVRTDGYCAYCSACKEMSEYLTNYCGSCGADMRGTWNETD